MPFQVIPREQAFFDLFEQAAANVAAASAELAVMVGRHPGGGGGTARRIRALEHASDDLTRQIIRLLDITFVTPFDGATTSTGSSPRRHPRLDQGRRRSARAPPHRVADARALAAQAEVLRKAGAATQTAVGGLRFADDVMPHVIEINRARERGRPGLPKGRRAAVLGRVRPMDVLKWKDILGQLEEAIDGCEDIANVIESIVVKHD